MTQTLRVARLDFLTIQQYLGIRQLGFFLLIAFVLCYMNGTSSFSIGILMMYGLFYTAYPFAIGEKTKIDLLYASLPLQKKNLVFGRYLFAFLINLGSGVIAFLFTFLTALVLRQDFILGETAAAIVGCFFLFTLVEAIQMPFYFKLGYTKAKLLVFLPLIVVPAALFGLFRMAQERGLLDYFIKLGNQVSQNPLPLILFCLLGWMLFIAISVLCSLQNYHKREW